MTPNIDAPRLLCALCLFATLPLVAATSTPSAPTPAASAPAQTTSIAQLCPESALRRRYPYALPSLLTHIGEKTTLQVADTPVVLTSFEDPRLFEYPFIYANFADRSDWTLSPAEARNLKAYLERGGFLYIDAGITAEFLRDQAQLGQHHSFGEWAANPKLSDTFATLFPEQPFRPLPRSHPIFRTFYRGLPETENLPDSVREFVITEKWPDGTYSAVGLQVKGRLAVLLTPIIAMGWGKNHLDQWATTIRFRVRESTKGLSEYLQSAAYSGSRYEVAREDGAKDVIYCQKQALPAWAHEANQQWRIFRYYGSREISDFAHVFYTRLGTNIVLYALTH
jgi:hypothetical protein